MKISPVEELAAMS